MYENVLIKDLDNFGKGITYINNKIVFVENALPSEIVNLKITKETKKYAEAKVTKYCKTTKDRLLPACPYFPKCGGCNLLFYSYENTLKFKQNKVKSLFAKNKINYFSNITIIKNPHPFNYRNKLSLKIVNKQIGFYEEKSHNLIPISNCLIAHPAINTVLKNYLLLNLKNAELTIRTNTNSEILLIINTPEKTPHIDFDKLKSPIKLVGVVYNNKTIYGNNFYYERIGGFLFKVSYDSFFQVNPYITSELFNLIKNHIPKSSIVLDLYSGVGTLGLVSSISAQNVYSIEIIKNAVLNGNFNAKINQVNNIKFLLGDVKDTISKLNISFDTLIIDPPRKGLDKKTITFIKSKLPSNIIYISCDINTLIRDLKLLLEFYDLKEYKILDMFSYSYHLESFGFLKLK